MSQVRNQIRAAMPSFFLLFKTMDFLSHSDVVSTVHVRVMQERERERGETQSSVASCSGPDRWGEEAGLTCSCITVTCFVLHLNDDTQKLSEKLISLVVFFAWPQIRRHHVTSLLLHSTIPARPVRLVLSFIRTRSLSRFLSYILIRSCCRNS
jgi:hypothetical protein